MSTNCRIANSWNDLVEKPKIDGARIALLNSIMVEAAQVVQPPCRANALVIRFGQSLPKGKPSVLTASSRPGNHCPTRLVAQGVSHPQKRFYLHVVVQLVSGDAVLGGIPKSAKIWLAFQRYPECHDADHGPQNLPGTRSTSGPGSPTTSRGRGTNRPARQLLGIMLRSDCWEGTQAHEIVLSIANQI